MKHLHSFTINYEAAEIIKHIKKGSKSKYVSEAITQVRFLRNKNYELNQDLDQLERANERMQEVILTLQAKLDTHEKFGHMSRSNEPTQNERKKAISDNIGWFSRIFMRR
jgi:uncharacterized protein YigA (DUF484 family)